MVGFEGRSIIKYLTLIIVMSVQEFFASIVCVHIRHIFPLMSSDRAGKSEWGVDSNRWSASSEYSHGHSLSNTWGGRGNANNGQGNASTGQQCVTTPGDQFRPGFGTNPDIIFQVYISE